MRRKSDKHAAGLEWLERGLAHLRVLYGECLYPNTKTRIAADWNQVRRSILCLGGTVETLEGDPPLEGGGGGPGTPP